MFVFLFELIGGPFDGAPGLAWVAGEYEMPEQIQVGRCLGDGGCGYPRCLAVRREHPAYWVPRLELDAPVATVPYVRVKLRRIDEEHGIAEFVHGELDLGGFVDDREAVGMNLETAGGIAWRSLAVTMRVG